MTDPLRVLVIDDDKPLATALAEGLTRRGHAVTVTHAGKTGIARLRDDEFDVVLTDMRLGDTDGLSVVKQAKELQPDADVIVVTGFGEIKTAVEAVKLGASHYLTKPIDLGELRAVVDQAGERSRLARSNHDLRRQLDEKFGYEGVVGSGPKMQQVLRLLKAFAPSSAPVLVLGENGTGKELAAKALHTNGPRRGKPFVAMNCAALNENLLDDDMFGHEPGAYTGATGSRKGRFEHAHAGTLFLDEIGDMPPALQAKLLRTLENGEVTRIGANDPIKVDVRVVAATNRDLAGMVEEGKFRRDLYHRLKVGVVRLPSLRERREDLPLLVAHFLKELATKYQRPQPAVSEPVRKALFAYAWPGNVRELKNMLESMLVLDGDGTLGADDLPDELSGAVPPPAGADTLLGRPLAEVERYYTERALETAGGNREEAARVLGMGERTLYRKLVEWKKQDEAQREDG